MAAILCTATSQPAIADGRADWQGYAWQQIKLTNCSTDGATTICPPYHQKWDWKRNQWVDIALAFEMNSGRFRLSQTLSDRDAHDDDHVCVTLLVLDAAGNNIIVHHQNWYARHGTVMQDNFTYLSSRLANAATVQIGSKQCRQGAHQDDAVHAAVLAGMRP
ncbi:MAG: hypothetical protein ACOH2N_13220 [Devosia sp.]